MPGLLIPQGTSADITSYTPAGTISSTNVQDAVQELSSDITSTQSSLQASIASVEGVALLGL